MGKGNAKKIENDIEMLTSVLYRAFSAYNTETGEKVPDPVKFILDKVVEHATTEENYQEGYTQLKQKQKHLN